MEILVVGQGLNFFGVAYTQIRNPESNPSFLGRLQVPHGFDRFSGDPTRFRPLGSLQLILLSRSSRDPLSYRAFNFTRNTYVI